MNQPTGLFLGAGASYELGMPLVWELTDEIKSTLTPEKLRHLSQDRLSHNQPIDEKVLGDLIDILARPEVHYESVLGYLETQSNRPSNRELLQQYHGIYSWLVEAVYWIIYLRHTNNVPYIEGGLRYFSGIEALADLHRPLWCFSLNHDLLVECIAASNSIPCCSGFTDEIVRLPCRSATGAITGELSGRVLPGEKLDNSWMDFLRRGEKGINLLKIHGSLDIFTFRDGRDLLQIQPTSNSVAGVVESLRLANESLLYIDPQTPGGRAKVTNEIAYADHSGKMQILRRTLLSGAYKFDSRRTQVLPPKLLDHFRSNLNNVDELMCIGYGFGDIHINRVFRDWLERSERRRLRIVDPFRGSIPSDFLHLSPSIELVRSSATDFLDEVTGTKRSAEEKALKRLRAYTRRNGDQRLGELVRLIQTRTSKRIEDLIAWIGRSP